MRRGRIILSTLLFAAAVIMFSACSKTPLNNNLSVGGTIKADADFFEISILVNGRTTGITPDSDGKFFISDLKSGDVVSFSKKGYSFNSYTVGGFSVQNLEIVGTKDVYSVLVFYESEKGSVTGVGKYSYGETATLTFTPAAHYEFLGLYEKENLITAETTYSFVSEEDRVFVARFSAAAYPITLVKTADECVVRAPETARFGEEVEVTAEDSENYVFAYFDTDGEIHRERTMKYVVKNENPTINAVFYKRLDKPAVTFDGRKINVSCNENTMSSEIYIDKILCKTAAGNAEVSLTEFNVSDGTHEVEVVAKGNGFGESITKIEISYVRPYDVPKNVGAVVEGDMVYFTFQRVLNADGYDVFVNGKIVDEGALTAEIVGNTVKVRVDTLFDKVGKYLFSVRAKGERPESDVTSPVAYVYKGRLIAPTAVVENGILTVSHADNANLLVEINGVNVTDKLQNGTLALNDVLDENCTNAKIKVTATLDGYLPSSVEVIYAKEGGNR